MKSVLIPGDSEGATQHPCPSGDSPADRLLRLVHWSSAAGRQLRKHLVEVAGAFGLTDNELLVVWICQGPGRVQVDLAAAIGVSPAQMSGIVERLRSRGLVEMHRPTIDRRRQVCCTSADGQTLLSRIAPRLEQLAAVLEDTLSTDDQRAAEALCNRLAEAALTGRGLTARTETNDQDQQRVRKEAA